MRRASSTICDTLVSTLHWHQKISPRSGQDENKTHGTQSLQDRANLGTVMPYQTRAVMIRRRAVLASLLAGSLLVACGRGSENNPMASAASFVKLDDRWDSEDLFAFLRALPPAAMLQLKQAQGLLAPDSTEQDLLGLDEDARDIQTLALRLSSSSLTYRFRDATELNYHEMVSWVAKKVGVDKELVESAATFGLEREVQKLVFAEIWDKLTVEERQDLLQQVDPKGKIADKVALAAMGGSAALAVLSGTVAFTGFAFYTSMTAAIAAAASAVGVTLPFAAYAGATTAVGVLSGPIGWAIAGVAGLSAVLVVGRPNVQKSTALVAQIHALKVEALQAADVPEDQIFGT